MFIIWQSVQVSNQAHPRVGQAGTIQGTNPAKPDESSVKFDVDGQEMVIQNADLKAL